MNKNTTLITCANKNRKRVRILLRVSSDQQLRSRRGFRYSKAT